MPTGEATSASTRRARRHELCNALLAAEAATEALRHAARSESDALLAALEDCLATVRALTVAPAPAPAVDGPEPIPEDELHTVAINDLVAERVAVARARGLEVEVRRESELVVHACRRRLGQVLENLLVNAARHAHGRGVVVHVDRQHGMARLSVMDRGPGLPRATVALLAPGAAPPPVGEGPRGHGLTLSVRMARAMGGALEHAPRPGGGAVMTLSVPLAVPALLDVAEDVVEVVEPMRSTAADVRDGDAVALLDRDRIQPHDDIGVHGRGARRPQGHRMASGRRPVDDGDGDDRLEQDPQAVGKQGRRRAQGHAVGTGHHIHAVSGARRA